MQYFHDSFTTAWQAFQWICVVYCIGLAIEQLQPAESQQPLRRIGFNIAYTFVFLLLTNLLLPPLQAVTKPWIDRFGLAIPVAFPDGPLGQALQVFAFFFIIDFFYYWFHRAQHTFGWLWMQHKLHHSELSLNITSGNRHHWLEEPIRVFAMWLPMGLLFQQKPISMALPWSVLFLWGYFIHMNLRFSMGPLTPVMCGPQLHRIHHSNLREHRDKNFAAVFPIFDILFGTYCKPAKDTYPSTGLDDGEDLNGLVRSSLAPFRGWREQLASAFKSPRAKA